MSLLNGTTLAYIGDAVYEVIVREALIEKGFQKVDNLHKEAIKYTSAVGQKQALDLIREFLTEEEEKIFRRGRNASTDRKAKNASLADYRTATGFEAIIGFLHLEKRQERLEELIRLIIK